MVRQPLGLQNRPTLDPPVRPPKGTQAKTTTITVKVTKQEQAALIAIAGSAGKGLRWLIDTHLPRRTQ